jgi:hypothetical protein
MTDLERAYSAITSKAIYAKYFGYYDGDQPIMYASRRLEEIFANLDAVFTENWCSVVIDACLDRISLTGFEAGPYQERADTIIQDNELLLEADTIHEAALVCGEAFAIVWPDESGAPKVYYNDPRMVAVFYDGDNPRRMTMAAKLHQADDSTWRITLYYADRIEYYVSTKSDISSAAAFQPALEPMATNPYGQIPVFHFRPSRRIIKSDLKNVIPLQNGINKLLTDMMVAAEFGAFKQRYIISNVDTRGKVRNAPNEIWDLPAGDGVGQQTSVGEFSATDLNNYLLAVDNLAAAISSVTNTPRHYFFSSGGVPSGEALIVMEAPLNKKAQDRIEMFTPTWQAVIAFALFVDGVNADQEEIMPVFTEPETIQPKTSTEISQMRVAMGVPLNTALKREGWTQAELDAMADDQAEAQMSSQGSLALALMNAERQFNAGDQEREAQVEENANPAI